MTWIKTASLENNANLLEALQEMQSLYPPEYAVPVPTLPTSQDGAEIVMSHSLIPSALKHAFSTFGVLLSPELPLSRKDHELIAATVSALNDCFY